MGAGGDDTAAVVADAACMLCEGRGTGGGTAAGGAPPAGGGPPASANALRSGAAGDIAAVKLL